MSDYNVVDILRWVEYDTLKLKGGEAIKAGTEYRLFVEPISKTKSLLETSMRVSGRFWSPKHYNITHSQIAFANLNHSIDTNSFRDYTRYELMLGNRSMDAGPISRYHSSLSNKEDFSILIKEAKKATKLGAKIIGNHVDYRIGNEPIGHHILLGLSFYITITIDENWTPKSDFRFIYFLEGVQVRGIQ